MPYFFARRDGDRVVIEGPDARHLARSLRARPGESIAVVDPAGLLLDVTLTDVSAQRVVGDVVSARPHRPEPRLSVTVALSMVPATTLETVLARCTELGAARFVLVESDRSVARSSKRDRWATICREAAMLAGRLRIPDVDGPLRFGEALDAATSPVVLERSSADRLATLNVESEVTLFVGPEGGWSEREIDLGSRFARSLGPRNLRVETAASAALAVVLASSGDL